MVAAGRAQILTSIAQLLCEQVTSQVVALNGFAWLQPMASRRWLKFGRWQGLGPVLARRIDRLLNRLNVFLGLMIDPFCRNEKSDIRLLKSLTPAIQAQN